MHRQAEIVITNNATGHHGYIQWTGDQELIKQILDLLRVSSLVGPNNTVTILIRPSP